MAKPHPFLDPARFWLNSVYLLILCIAGGAILELLKDLIPSNTALSMGSASAVCIVFSFGIWLGCRRDFLKWRESQLVTRIFVPTKRALPAEGLIALCGPTASEFRSTNPAFAAACHHRPKLKHLWLITSMAGEETAR